MVPVRARGLFEERRSSAFAPNQRRSIGKTPSQMARVSQEKMTQRLSSLSKARKSTKKPIAIINAVRNGLSVKKQPTMRNLAINKVKTKLPILKVENIELLKAPPSPQKISLSKTEVSPVRRPTRQATDYLSTAPRTPSIFAESDSQLNWRSRAFQSTPASRL